MSRLKDFINQKQTRIQIMEGREKEELKSLLEKVVHINNFDFLTGTDGEYAVFTIAEDEKSFYFGSSVLTDTLKDIDNAGLKAEVQAEGLGVKLTERKSKASNRTYIALEFVED